MKKILWPFLDVFETVAIAALGVFLVRSFVVQPFLVNGSSMEPSFQNGNYLLVDELTYRFREPERGEVIVFKYPGDHKSYYIKRIIGLPGEKVIINESGVYVQKGDEKIKLGEPYISYWRNSDYLVRELEPNEYFVMGDNRNFSFDSRSWGPVSSAEIIGLARLRLWPINEVMAFTVPQY